MVQENYQNVNNTAPTIINQLNDQVLGVCRAVFERNPDQDPPALTFYKYYIPGSHDAPPHNVLIRNDLGQDAGSWTVTEYRTDKVLASGNNLLEFIQYQTAMSETQVLDWVRDKGLVTEPSPPPQERAGDGGHDGQEPGDAEKEKAQFAEEVAEPDKPIVGTKANPFCKWKYRWFDQILIDPEIDFRLGYVLARVANNETGGCWPSAKTLAAYLGKSASCVRRGLKKFITQGHMNLIRQGGLKGDKKDSNHYQMVLKANQEDVLKVFKSRKEAALKDGAS